MHHFLHRSSYQLIRINSISVHREYLFRHKKSHRKTLQLCILCNQRFEYKFELQIHTQSHAEKSFDCDYCDMTFLKRVERANHINRMHHGEVIHRFGIIERFAFPGKSSINPYLRKSDIFEGYKSKDMIQTAPLPAETPPVNLDALYQPSTSGTQKPRNTSQAAVARRSSSSSYSDSDDDKPKPRRGRVPEDTEPEPEKNKKDKDGANPVAASNSGNVSFIDPGPLSLEYFDIFSIDTLGMNDRLASRSRQIDLNLFDNYVPPYDIMFAKLFKKNRKNESTVVKMDTH